jgi:Kinesin-associated protein (KAP)
MQRKRQKQA